MINNDYFKGWYFKCSSNDKTIAFIPAYHRNNHKKTASLQIITDDASYNVTFNSLEYVKAPLRITLGKCIFSENGITLNIETKNLSLSGKLQFYDLSPIRYDIMGPFYFVPFMQCRHSVYSMMHKIDGEIILNGERFCFRNGIGYTEGDSGHSFPKEYIWTQCCYNNCSLMLSVADIPMLGFHFTGIIGVVIIDKKEYRIATYLGAKIKYIEKNTINIKQGDYELTAQLIKSNPHPLYAPTRGKMERTIHESASCKAYYRFSRKGRLLCEFISHRAGFEFEYS